MLRLLPALIIGLTFSTSTATTYCDTLRAFSLNVPEGWFVEAVDYSVIHYRDVFLCVNNRRAGLRVTHGRFSPFNVEVVSELLKPGDVYIDFAHSEGPGQSAKYGPGRADSFERELHSFFQDPKPYKETAEIEWYSLGFVKWGSWWSVWIMCGRPYSDVDKHRAFDMLKSLHFHELPIVNSTQAVGVAVKHLPAEAQLDEERPCNCCFDGWLANGGRNGRHETCIQQGEEWFLVKFVLYATGSSEEVVGTWEYLVRSDGAVEPR